MHIPGSWLLQIFRLSDAAAQELTAALLAGLDDIAVESTATDHDHYVIVESTDDNRAFAVAALIRAVDPAARLTHTSTPASGRRSVA